MAALMPAIKPDAAAAISKMWRIKNIVAGPRKIFEKLKFKFHRLADGDAFHFAAS